MVRKTGLLRTVVSNAAVAFINNFWLFVGGQFLGVATVLIALSGFALSLYPVSYVAAVMSMIIKASFGLPVSNMAVQVPSIGMHSLIGVAFALACLAVTVILWMGFIVVALKALRNQPVKFSDYFSQASKVVKASVMALLLVISLTLGLVLFVIPGLYILVTYGLAIYYMVDEDAGIMESLKKSAALTQGKKLRVFGVLFVIALIGNMLRLVGYSLSWIGGASLYEELRKEQV